MSLEVPVYPRILVRTDGSPETEQAVSLGLGLARTDDPTVHALYVTDGSGYSAVTDAQAHEQLRSAAEKLRRRATADVAETAAEFDLTVERERRQWTSFGERLDDVEEQDFVMKGSSGRSNNPRLKEMMTAVEKGERIYRRTICASPRKIKNPRTSVAVVMNMVADVAGS
ncbi:universal stress protein [Haloferax volcanii]|uniref:universal stress protein n=1 Tax=Haloferax volcanii TaxID=2246 RepID=UPI0023DB467B|nr:universal stress protein [Haloferax lucentense]